LILLETIANPVVLHTFCMSIEKIREFVKEVVMQAICQLNKEDICGRRSGVDRRAFPAPTYSGLERRINGERRIGTRKRGNPRFRAKDLTFVKLQSESDEDLGQLLDISKGGLSLRQFVNEEKSQDFSELDIFSSGSDFNIAGIPFRTVSNTVLTNYSPFSTTVFRRYGLQFENLTSAQAVKLDHFLLNHTLGSECLQKV